MHSRDRIIYALGTVIMATALVLVGPVFAENSTTIDLSTQPHLKSWSNIIPNANKRFVVLVDFNSEAVLDRETGLTWQKSPTTMTQNWTNARSICAERSIGGRYGWRLPSVHELMSLVDPTQTNPSLPLGHPFVNVQPSLYWSATTSAEDTALAWYVGLFNGNLSSPNAKTETYHLWCVRAPTSGDTY